MNARNLFVGAIALVLLVVGGFWVINNVDFSGDVPVQTEEICVTPETGRYAGMEVCATEQALLNMGLLETPDETVTVVVDGVTISGSASNVDAILNTPVPTSVSPVVPSDTEVAQENVEVDDTFWEFADFPASVVPYRTTFMHEQDTHIEGTEFFLGDPGVRGVLTNAEARNPSAVLIGPDTQISLTSDRETVLLNEDGYMFISGAGFTMDVCGKYTLTFPDMAEFHHEWQVALRGRNFVEGVDGNCAVTFSEYQNGAVLVTRFPVAVGANGFLSAEWVQQQVDNAIGGNAGWETDKVSLFLVDINDDAYSLNWFEHNEWSLVNTNVEYDS